MRQFRGRERFGPQSDIPQQNPPLGKPYNNRLQADQAVMQQQKERPGQHAPPLTLRGLEVVRLAGYPVTMVDRGGIIAASGVPQLIIPQNSARQRLFVVNPDTAIETLYVTFKNTTSAIPLPPGGVLEEESPLIITDEIWAYAPTIGHVYWAYEGVPQAI